MSKCAPHSLITRADHLRRTRKWKEKLQKWNFHKYLNIDNMNIIVAKQQKRAMEGKDTVFMYGSAQITSERIENFKRRKVSNVTTHMSPSAGT